MLFFLLPLFTFAEPAPGLESINFGKELTRMMTTLGVLIILFVATLFVIKYFLNHKTMKMNASSDIQIQQKRALSAKTMLYVVEFEGKKLLVSESSLEVRPLQNKLGKMDDTEFATLMEEGSQSKP